MKEDKLIEFAMWLTGHDEKTIIQMFYDWLSGKNKTRYESESETARILRIVCDENNVSIEDVKSKSKEKRLMPAKREYCYFAYQLDGVSLNTMAGEINRSHCDVLYHKNVVLSWLEIPAYNLKEKLEGIEKRLKI